MAPEAMCDPNALAGFIAHPVKGNLQRDNRCLQMFILKTYAYFYLVLEILG